MNRPEQNLQIRSIDEVKDALDTWGVTFQRRAA